MPKMKTNRSAAKRFKAKKSGEIKRKQAFMRHCQSAKTKKQKNDLRKGAYVNASDLRGVRRLLGLE